MIDPVQVFLEANALKTPLYPPTSRYYGIGSATLEIAGGKIVVYLRRRLIPQPDEFVVVQGHSVVEGDRVDNLANRYLGDPEQYWRLCDANIVMHPRELTETVGRRIRVALPEGALGGRRA